MGAGRVRGEARRPAALTIAGLDPSGGAGMAADLRAFDAAGAWGAAVCAAITVQSTRGVRAVRAIAPALVIAQADEVLADLDVRAIKTGALGSAANVRAVVRLVARHPGVPVVVDPVMLPTRGRAARLDGGASVGAMLALARAAALVTPNLVEAGALLGAKTPTARGARGAALALVASGCAAVLVKGGHARGAEAVDWFATARGARPLARPRRVLPPIHGTGCVLAALVAGRLALRASRGRPDEDELFAAVAWARAVLDAALAAPIAVGSGLRVLDVPRRPAVR